MYWSRQAVEQNASTIYAISLQEFLNTPILAETQQSMNIPCAREVAFVINSSPFKALQNCPLLPPKTLVFLIILFHISHCK